MLGQSGWLLCAHPGGRLPSFFMEGVAASVPCTSLYCQGGERNEIHKCAPSLVPPSRPALSCTHALRDLMNKQKGFYALANNAKLAAPPTAAPILKHPPQNPSRSTKTQQVNKNLQENNKSLISRKRNTNGGGG